MKNIQFMIRSFVVVGLAMTSLGCASDDPTDDEPVISGPPFICADGMAGPYPCNGYDLMGRIDVETLAGMTGAKGNDSWGWTDPITGKEFVMMGTTTGTAFIDVTEPTNPVLLGRLPTATVNSHHRDIKVYDNHAFIVAESEAHGMQVFDLTRLRSVPNRPESFTADAQYTGFGKAHNLAINEESGFAYAVGSDTFDGGPHFINIQDPKNPIGAGGFEEASYSHDGQALIYSGPDSDYTGRELFIGSNEEIVAIVDVTDKDNPTLIASIDYENVGYVHQGWFTDDLKYFLVGDELDEIEFGYNTRTLVFDFTDLDEPVLHMEYEGPTAAVDHNGYPKGDLFYLANYTAGVRIIDISGLENGVMEEVGFFDSYPANNDTEMDGVWNVYPFFESGNIIISDRDNGLFIIRKSGT